MKCVETFYVNTQQELDRLYQQFLDAKFEGAMIRPANQPYQFSYNDYHSTNLLKMKPRYDAEYEIIGYDHGEKGKASKALMMICKTAQGTEFYVTPAMELAWRIEKYAEMGQRVNVDGKEMTVFERDYKGRKLIVYYDEKTVDDVPARASTEMQVRDWD